MIPIGVLDNIKKIKRSQEKKSAINRIGMEAVKQGALESSFTSEYSSFSVSLRQILEKALIENDDKSITIAPSKKDTSKYLNYVLHDDHFTAYYNIKKDKAGNLTFSLNNDLNGVINGSDDDDIDVTPKTKYEEQLQKFLDM